MTLKPNKREQLFLDTIAEKGKTYIFYPRWFRFDDGSKYMPDFYCLEDRIYIEVAGSRQAYNFNKHKYKKMKTEYPNVQFRIVRIDGGHDRVPNLNVKPIKQIKTHPIETTINGDGSSLINHLKIKLLESLKRQSLNFLAKNIGLKQPTLWRITNRQSEGSIESWEKIERFYGKENKN